MPGPLLTITIAQTAKRGFIASILLVAGHSLLELLVIVGLAFGLGSVLAVRPVIGTITVLGGAMLLWMGWGMIRDARSGALDLQVTSTDGGTAEKQGILRNPVILGMAVSISNPYWVIWWATIGLTLFATLSRNAVGTIGAFYIGHISGDIIWYLAVGVAVATGRKVINPSAYRIIVQICGIFLLFLGGAFLYLIASGNLWQIRMSIDLLNR
jgi:threonine/homoserine/homoserine lactone efflux protein